MEKQTVAREEFNSFTLNPHQFYDAFLLSVPDFLEELSEEEKSEILPASIVDTVAIFANQKKDISLQISLSKNTLPNYNMKPFVLEIAKKCARLTPGFQLFGCGIKVVNGVTVGCLDYKSSGLVDDMYTVLFVFSIKNSLFQGIWSVPFDAHKECLQTFFAFINTIHTEL